jgi:hypothetical protein
LGIAVSESYFARLRRGEIGHHHHITGPYLAAFARESAWRENYRRQPNGTLVNLAARAVLWHPKFPGSSPKGLMCGSAL